MISSLMHTDHTFAYINCIKYKCFGGLYISHFHHHFGPSDKSAGATVAANQRRQRLAQDFLMWMDQTGELLSLAERQEVVDPVKLERMEVSSRASKVVSVFICIEQHTQWEGRGVGG